ncbi:MAG TPA: hypothetical protein VJ249_10395 [Candidatus Bathyarchaeia archaeon]|nr:hypothetical protein [Candidatus Bathyarchaeia archaeon]
MELTDKHANTSTQSWINRAQRNHPNKVDYSSELESWLQSAMLEAEEKKDFNKKGKLLSLLKDL